VSKLKVFDRAWKKAILLQPGQASTLIDEEHEMLLGAIRACDRRKEVALQRFWEHVQERRENEKAASYLRTKLIFKQLWMEGKIS
jgi:hypothetical protein